MTSRRQYDDGCALAHALDLVGERWALLVVRELMVGPKRFGDLRDALRGISPALLSARLDGLTAASLVMRRRLPPPAAASVYELTPWARELAPAMVALGRWAARSPRFTPGPMSAAAIILSMETMFDPARAGYLSTAIGLVFGEAAFRAEVSDRRLAIKPSQAGPTEATFAGTPDQLAAILYHGAAHGAAVRGDAARFARFAALFALPSPAPVTAEWHETGEGPHRPDT